MRAHCRSISKWTMGAVAAAMASWAYLDLQDVITTDSLVMHVVVGIIGISTVLVLHKREPDDGGVSKQRPGRGVSGCRVYAYSLLEAERGAGMSQRTSLP